jgi:hypothetical protein
MLPCPATLRRLQVVASNKAQTSDQPGGQTASPGCSGGACDDPVLRRQSGATAPDCSPLQLDASPAAPSPENPFARSWVDLKLLEAEDHVRAAGNRLYSSATNLRASIRAAFHPATTPAGAWSPPLKAPRARPGRSSRRRSSTALWVALVSLAGLLAGSLLLSQAVLSGRLATATAQLLPRVDRSTRRPWVLPGSTRTAGGVLQQPPGSLSHAGRTLVLYALVSATDPQHATNLAHFVAHAATNPAPEPPHARMSYRILLPQQAAHLVSCAQAIAAFGVQSYRHRAAPALLHQPRILLSHVPVSICQSTATQLPLSCTSRAAPSHAPLLCT